MGGGRLPGPLTERPAGVRLRRPLESVARVGDPQAMTVVGAGDRAGALLDDVGEFVGEGVPVGATLPEHHVRSRGVGAGVHLRRLARGEQPPDHPSLEAMPETRYLTFYLFQVTGDLLPGPA